MLLKILFYKKLIQVSEYFVMTFDNIVLQSDISLLSGIFAAIITSVSAAIVSIITLIHNRKTQREMDNRKREWDREKIKLEDQWDREKSEILLKKQLENTFDITLREKRFVAYEKLWKLIHYFKEQTHNERKIDFEDFLKQLRNWYHDEGGGMWLSSESMEYGYKKLKKKVIEYKDNPNEFSKGDEMNLTPLYEIITKFRTYLTLDLGSRRISEITDYEGSRKFKCEKCEIGFSTEQHLEEHNDIVHKDKKDPYS